MIKKDEAVDTLLESLGVPLDSMDHPPVYPPDIYRLSTETILWIASKVEALKPAPVATEEPGEATRATSAV